MKSSRVLERWRGAFAITATPGSSRLPVAYQLRCFSQSHVRNAANDGGEGSKGVPELPTAAKSSILGNLKRGRGGRSSFSGIVATVFGPSGFLGPYVINHLGKMGSQVIVAHRCDPYDVRDAKVSGDLGQILYNQIDLRDEDSIRRSIKYSNVVINLIGRDYATKRFSLEQVHVEGARRIARLSKEAGVERLIHLSALNATEKPKRIILPKGSEFLASKWRGEQAVREEFPEAVIIRPSDIFGAEDRFVNYYVRGGRRVFKYMPLWKSGEATWKQPVHSSDVAAGIINAIRSPIAPGRIIDAVGPKRYQLSELVDWMFRLMRRSPEMWGYIRGPLDPITILKIACSSAFAFKFSKSDWQRVEREYVTDERTPGALDLEDLGITNLKPMEDYVPWLVKGSRAYNYYTDDLGEFPDAGIPPSSSGARNAELLV
ncbi:NADH dehydrogenase [ubiquinone] 1 alpha subcomplex subunit 9, mitochondrial [Hypsibius exemplaris]|uniref:NADH dehydrogenase [ubiquinone] 1 alpha subcomplex subunit 9, mitochondrial n=1 Tax=Hypsibius exemplaris TaxID=2072580 RepID=A0A1W0WM34_HYPEX|nr:NADH dehydrogenase [ubiquinone] 1 alpha subcomplex subunit 9, mitochondrial [Hypsibius exemplaris]